MIVKANAWDSGLPWQSEAYHIAARYRELDIAWEAKGIPVLYLEVDTGGRVLPHAKKMAELYFCLEGTGTFTVGEEETGVEHGDYLVVPGGTIQGVTNEGQSPLRLLVIRPPIAALDPRHLLRGLLRG